METVPELHEDQGLKAWSAGFRVRQWVCQTPTFLLVVGIAHLNGLLVSWDKIHADYAKPERSALIVELAPDRSGPADTPRCEIHRLIYIRYHDFSARSFVASCPDFASM